MAQDVFDIRLVIVGFIGANFPVSKWVFSARIRFLPGRSVFLKCCYRNFSSIPAACAFLGRFPAPLFSRASLGNDFPNWILRYRRPSFLARV